MDYYHGRAPSIKAFDYWEARGVSYYPIEHMFNANELQKLDVLFLCVSHPKADTTPDEITILNQWIYSGGIFIINPLTWVAKEYDDKDPYQNAVNLFVKSAGIFFSTEYLHNESFKSDIKLSKGQIGFSKNTMKQHPITEGIERVVFTGVPGVIQINHGEVLIWGEERKPGKIEKLPYLVSVPYGKGLIIGFQHNGILNDDCFTDGTQLSQFDNVRLWQNILDYTRKIKFSDSKNWEENSKIIEKTAISSSSEDFLLPQQPEKKDGPKDKKDPRKKEGVLKPKQPELLREILWLKKYGLRHWKLILLAVLLMVILGVWTKLDLFSGGRKIISSEAKTTGDSSPAIIQSGADNTIIVNYDSTSPNTNELDKSKLVLCRR